MPVLGSLHFFPHTNPHLPRYDFIHADWYGFQDSLSAALDLPLPFATPAQLDDRGAILSPLLFALHISDLQPPPGTYLVQYADDTCLLASSISERLLGDRLARGLTSLNAQHGSCWEDTCRGIWCRERRVLADTAASRDLVALHHKGTIRPDASWVPRATQVATGRGVTAAHDCPLPSARHVHAQPPPLCPRPLPSPLPYPRARQVTTCSDSLGRTPAAGAPPMWRALAVASLGLLHLASASFVGPFFLKEPSFRVDFANDTGARVDCTAGGSPQPDLFWVTGGGKPVRPVSQIVEILANGSLLFLPFHPSAYRHDIHANVYRCVASNPVGRIVSRDVRIRAVVLQYFEVQIYYNKNILRGNTAALKCTIPSFVRDYVTVTSWVQDSSFNIYPSMKGDGKYHMLPSGELLIRRVDEGDKYHSYQCRVVNTLTGVTLLSVGYARFTVTGKYHMLPSGEPLSWRVDEGDKYHSYQCRVVNTLTGVTLLSVGYARFTVTDSNAITAPRPLEKQITINAKKGQSVVLPCVVEGNPPPTYKWFRQDQHQRRTAVEAGERVFAVGECLAILHADESDAGHWACAASNSAGTERLELRLHVTSPLAVAMQPAGQVTVDVGGRVELRCVVSGAAVSPPEWLKDGQALLAGVTADKLQLDNVQRKDAGMYQCVVRSEDDCAQSSMQLQLGAAHPQLLYKFINQTLQPGPPVSIKCIATGNPTPHISWRLDGFPLPQNERFLIGQYVTMHGDVISHVNISSVQIEDGGIYKCTASNRIGDVSHSAEMRVYGLPFIRPMSNISAIAGEPLYIACPVAGYPIEKITWERDGDALPLNRRQHVFPNGTLLLQNVQRDADKGDYRCRVSNKQGHTSAQTLTLNVIVPPRIGPFTFGELIEGVRTQVQCVIQAGDPPLILKWLKDDSAIPLRLGIQLVEDAHSSTLAIPRVSRMHAGNYTCIANNPANKEARVTAQLVVSVPPRWISEPRDVNVTRDDQVMLHCQAEGFPNPNHVWRKVIGRQPNEYQNVSYRSRGIQLFPNGTLYIRQVLPEHEGDYLCEATNGIGAGLSAMVTLVVHVPPDFEVKSSQAIVRRGASQTLACETHGDHPLTISWHRGNMKISAHHNPRYEIKESPLEKGLISELHITNTMKSDTGIFTCIAENPFGKSERTIHLHVQDAPGRPKNLRLLDSGSKRVKLTWHAPSDSGNHVLQYTVQYQLETRK
ncbi:cell adhesion molecule Dscam2-like [Bacillus rossius redtenbacheri]|uniref:cell adhesion molecule Dscam2-like n=1 Tax=Bacillus rossius redtenbacheri TaxID=93214 RepID=UPI002FDCCA2D